MPLHITVYAYDLINNNLISNLAATNLTWTERINDAGQCTFNLALTDPATQIVNQQILSYQGGPFKVIIDNNGTILFTGIAWNTLYDSMSKVLTVDAKGIMSYFDHVTIDRDYSAISFRAGITQPALAQKVIANAQNKSISSSIGVGTQLVLNTTPRTIVPTYTYGSYVMVNQVLSDITTAVTPGSGGVDYYIADSYSALGFPQHTCVLTTPRCGRVAGSTGLEVDLSRVIHYSWPTDAETSANQVTAVGSGTGTTQPVARAVATLSPTQTANLIALGDGITPLLEAVLSYGSVSSPDQLAALARGVVQMLGSKASIATPLVTIPVDYPPMPLGSWLIGDDVRLFTAPTVRFPQGLDEFWRIVAYTVTIPDQGVPTVELTLNPPPIF